MRRSTRLAGRDLSHSTTGVNATAPSPLSAVPFSFTPSISTSAAHTFTQPPTQQREHHTPGRNNTTATTTTASPFLSHSFAHTHTTTTLHTPSQPSAHSSYTAHRQATRSPFADDKSYTTELAKWEPTPLVATATTAHTHGFASKHKQSQSEWADKQGVKEWNMQPGQIVGETTRTSVFTDTCHINGHTDTPTITTTRDYLRTHSLFPTFSHHVSNHSSTRTEYRAWITGVCVWRMVMSVVWYGVVCAGVLQGVWLITHDAQGSANGATVRSSVAQMFTLSHMLYSTLFLSSFLGMLLIRIYTLPPTLLTPPSRPFLAQCLYAFTNVSMLLRVAGTIPLLMLAAWSFSGVQGWRVLQTVVTPPINDTSATAAPVSLIDTSTFYVLSGCLRFSIVLPVWTYMYGMTGSFALQFPVLQRTHIAQLTTRFASQVQSALKLSVGGTVGWWCVFFVAREWLARGLQTVLTPVLAMHAAATTGTATASATAASAQLVPFYVAEEGARVFSVSATAMFQLFQIIFILSLLFSLSHDFLEVFLTQRLSFGPFLLSSLYEPCDNLHKHLGFLHLLDIAERADGEAKKERARVYGSVGWYLRTSIMANGAGGVAGAAAAAAATVRGVQSGSSVGSSGLLGAVSSTAARQSSTRAGAAGVSDFVPENQTDTAWTAIAVNILHHLQSLTESILIAQAEEVRVQKALLIVNPVTTKPTAFSAWFSRLFARSAVTFTATQRTELLFANWQIHVWAIQALSFLAAHSLTEDRHGIVQTWLTDLFLTLLTCESTVGDYLHTSVYGVEQQIERAQGKRGGQASAVVVQTHLSNAISRLLVVYAPYLDALELPPKHLHRLKSEAGLLARKPTHITRP